MDHSKDLQLSMVLTSSLFPGPFAQDGETVDRISGESKNFHRSDQRGRNGVERAPGKEDFITWTDQQNLECSIHLMK